MTLAEQGTRTVLRVVTVAIVMTATVVVLGAYTRLVDAGLGCPDWPGCYGLVGVPETAAEIAAAESLFPDAPVEVDKAWPEMIHRYFATGLGVVILTILGLAIRARLPLGYPIALTLLVVLQGAFGAWTVTLKLWPQVVTAHLVGGFSTLALLWTYALALRRPFEAAHRPESTVRGVAFWALVAVVIQVALGGWVTSNYAALACPDFPTCHGQWVPDTDFAKGFDFTQDVGPNYLGGQLSSDARVAIQLGHRIGAVVVFLVVGYLAHRLRGSPLAIPLSLALVAQVALGIANVLASLPLAIAVLHNAVGAVLLLMVLTVNVAARTESVTASSSRAPRDDALPDGAN